jgi:putative glycosyltransferase (TIGR04348 family)
MRGLGHSVRVLTSWRGEACDALLALHAKKSHASIARFARTHPERPICLVLAGTDLYVDLPHDARARASLGLADELVVLQEGARARLGLSAHVIPQSARPVRARAQGGAFEVLVLGHLRPVKDPFRGAQAARALPSDSRVVVLHAGKALSRSMAARARAEMRRNPRYRWLGDLPHARAQALLARARAFVLSSRSEGGSLALTEALVQGVPVLASRIEANVAMLGARHPGLFPFGDTRALAGLMLRCERDERFRGQLARASRERGARFSEARERAAWRRLLRALRPGKKGPPRSP